MTNADNMFYSLGYEKEENFKVGYYCCKGSYNTIDFYYEEKTISLNGDFNMQELKAINEKVKELGWYD